MGGYVARAIARAAPERVEALVLVASSARADTPEEVRRKAAAGENARQKGFDGLSRSAVQRSLHPERSSDKALIVRIREMSRRLGPEVFARQTSEARKSDLGELREIRCPTLVVAADRDLVRSLDEAAELSHGIPGATLRIVEGSGHMIPIERPAELASIIVAWLQEQV